MDCFSFYCQTKKMKKYRSKNITSCWATRVDPVSASVIKRELPQIFKEYHQQTVDKHPELKFSYIEKEELFFVKTIRFFSERCLLSEKDHFEFDSHAKSSIKNNMSVIAYHSLLILATDCYNVEIYKCKNVII